MKKLLKIWLFLWRDASARIGMLILFGGLGAAGAAGLSSITGNSPISCSPPTGPAVLCVSSTLVDARTASVNPIPTTDAGYEVTFNCPTDCTAVLPSSNTPFAANTTLTVKNISNAAAAPIYQVGTPEICATNSCSYSAQAAGDLIRVSLSYGSAGPVTAVAAGSNACVAVPNTVATSGNNGVGQYSCPNIAASGSLTVSATISGSPTYTYLVIAEWHGAATSSPDDQGANTTGTLTAPTLATAGAVTARGEWIDAIFNNTAGAHPTPAQAAYSYSSPPTGFANSYFPANGLKQYTFNWASSGALYLGAISGIKPQNPVSVVNLCPGVGTTLIDETTNTPSAGCTPLVAGASAAIIYSASTYLVTITPPAGGSGPTDDVVASRSLTLQDCRNPLDVLGYNTASPIVLTVPIGLPPDCYVNLKNGGTAKFQVAVGAGMNPLEVPSGYIYSGQQYTQSNINISAGGATANFGGTITNTNP